MELIEKIDNALRSIGVKPEKYSEAGQVYEKLAVGKDNVHTDLAYLAMTLWEVWKSLKEGK